MRKLIYWLVSLQIASETMPICIQTFFIIKNVSFVYTEDYSYAFLQLETFLVELLLNLLLLDR